VNLEEELKRTWDLYEYKVPLYLRGGQLEVDDPMAVSPEDTKAQLDALQIGQKPTGTEKENPLGGMGPFDGGAAAMGQGLMQGIKDIGGALVKGGVDSVGDMTDDVHLYGSQRLNPVAAGKAQVAPGDIVGLWREMTDGIRDNRDEQGQMDMALQLINEEGQAKGLLQPGQRYAIRRNEQGYLEPIVADDSMTDSALVAGGRLATSFYATDPLGGVGAVAAGAAKLATGADAGAIASGLGAGGAVRVHGISQLVPAEKIAEDATRGLQVPAEGATERLRLLEQRAAAVADGKPLPGGNNNERILIKAPRPDLPDFVVGNLTFDDWIERTQKMLGADEIAASAKWYDEIRGVFLKHTGGDEKKTDLYMRGWLVAQQNVDVTGAMNNLLLQAEQFARQVPVEDLKAGGMPNPTYAARQVLKGEPIEYGIGQKITDFVDAAERKDVRSWMNNDPRGGAPFVVDVHTARDTGMVDDTLINHLKRLGYDVEGIDLKRDFITSPSGTQYENRAGWGRDLTDHLNSIGWQGRSDWKPYEVQAVGWMSMTKLTADKMDDVTTGLEGVLRRISFEAAPGEGSPWAAKFGDRFSALATDKQAVVTQSVASRAMEMAKEVSGIDVRTLVHGTGGWENFQNPAAVGQAMATRSGAEIAANTIGYLTQQTEVWVNALKPKTKNPKAFAVDFIEDGSKNLATNDGLREFWGQIMAADPSGLFRGYQPIRTSDGGVGIRVIVDKGGAKTQASLESAINGAITSVVERQGFTVRVRGHEADLVKARNDWKGTPDGQAYLGRLEQLGVRRTAADLDPLRRELEEIFERELGKAEGRAAGAASSGTAAGPAAAEGLNATPSGAAPPAPPRRTKPNRSE